MDPIAPLAQHPPSWPDRVPLGRDMVAFLVVAPIAGSFVSSFGLWAVALLVGPPVAIGMTLLLGGLPALASLALARLVRTGWIRWRLAVGLGGGAAMAVQSRLWLSGVSEGSEGLTAWWTISALVVAQFAHEFAGRIRHPVRLAVLLLGPPFAWCLIWFAIVYMAN